MLRTLTTLFWQVNKSTDNIGARRLASVLERCVEQVGGFLCAFGCHHPLHFRYALSVGAAYQHMASGGWAAAAWPRSHEGRQVSIRQPATVGASWGSLSFKALATRHHSASSDVVAALGIARMKERANQIHTASMKAMSAATQNAGQLRGSRAGEAGEG